MNAMTRHWDMVRDAVAHDKHLALHRLRSDAATFLPAAMEIIEQPVSPTARVTAWVFLVGLCLTIAWLTLGKIDVIASAQGRLVPVENVKLVQPSEGGVIRAILVHDGEHVRKGQPLIELDPTVSTAEAVQAGRALESAELDAARSRAVLSALDGHGLDFRPPEGTAPAVAATERALAQAQFANLTAGAAAHAADQRVAEAARSEASGQIAKLTETLPLLDEQIAANEQLLAHGYVSRLKVIEMRRQRLSVARDRDISLDTARKAGAQIAVAASQRAQGIAEARSQVLGDLAKAESDARLRREELVKARQRSSLQRLLSPVDGTVAQLSVHTVGGVVEAAKPIMVIVPSEGTLVAEVKLLNRDIGFVHAGQVVAVKVEAFPFTRYGTVPARIESIGTDAVEDEKLGLVYPVRITLDRGRIGDKVLTPGMSVTADVRTGRRSILSYLISPIDEASQEAGRER
jgi:hemolysin D